jgi:hypothetical protein
VFVLFAGTGLSASVVLTPALDAQPDDSPKTIARIATEVMFRVTRDGHNKYGFGFIFLLICVCFLC